MRGSKLLEPLRKKGVVKSGIRTHASGETATLTQRLRPLGHLDSHGFHGSLDKMISQDQITNRV